MNASTTRYISLTGYAALLLLLIIWHGFAFPDASRPWTVLGMILVPILLPLPGIIRGKPYTHAWSSYIILMYFIHGCVEAYANPAQRNFALLEIILTTYLFIGVIFYTRYRSRELKSRTTDTL